jgi:acid phosphatase (class A)
MARAVAGIVLVLSLVPAFGAEPLNYVEQSKLDPVELLPPPPAADSEETKAELDLIVRLQGSRTPKQVERAKSGAKLDMNAFSSAIGKWFTPENLPLTAQLLKNAEKDSKYYSETAKTAFGRKRPKFADKRVKVVIEGQEEASYPSGHATRGMLMAAIVADISPDNKADIMDKGWEIGWDRVIAGVHYPSDVVAGRVLGKAIARAMFENPAFKQDLAKAKSEFNGAKKRFAKK